MSTILKITVSILIVLAAGFLLPQHLVIPVKGANRMDWNPASFWYYPWGKSGTHKGIDIFAKKGQPVLSASSGVVWYSGQLSRGGNVVVVLGPKWRFHYYAHLDAIQAAKGKFVTAGMPIGTVGNTGNAAGKPAHLHYAIVSFFPLFWKADQTVQGWKKMYYLNPNEYLVTINNATK